MLLGEPNRTLLDLRAALGGDVVAGPGRAVPPRCGLATRSGEEPAPSLVLPSAVPRRCRVRSRAMRLPSGVQRRLPAPPDYLQRRSVAADALGKFGPAASNAVPALIGCLRVPGCQPLRFSAAVTLGGIGAAAKAAVPALTETLKDQDFNVRMEAAMALAKIGADYSQATPQLEALLHDTAPGVRLRAALALWRLQPGAPAASNRIARILLADPDPWLRAWAAVLIGDLGPSSAVFSPALRAALRDPDSRVQRNANSSLKRLNASVDANQENRRK